MALLSLSDAHLAYGHVALLDGAGLSLEAAERLGLIGRNGAGKSSLLKILASMEQADHGLLQLTQGLRIRYVAQEPEFDATATVFDAVSEGLGEARKLRQRFEEHRAGDDLGALQGQIEALGAWNWEQRVATTLMQLHLDGERRIDELSGGTRKRVALAQALVALPDVLLLDEPTNHLDLDAIAWLEELLRGYPGVLMVVSHDRAFLDAVVTRIVELDRGRLRSYPGDFSNYQRVKEGQLAAEVLANARGDKLLAQEEIWVRKGVEARRTRSVARVLRLEALRAQRLARRESVGQARLAIDSGMRSGRIVAEAREISMRFGAQTVIEGFSATILRGDKVGLIGPNGSGKTTLLKLLLGELVPLSGTVRRGTNLAIAYFDQLRSGLDLQATLADSISPGSEWIEIGATRKHVMSYLGDFLFAPERANSPVHSLSGGERNRLLLARLFALPANLLVLDEPTNDLDIDTLELLEDRLQAYAGTVFLVSHDRRFLDNVVTSTIAWAGDEAPGLWREHEGGYADWRLQRERMLQTQAPIRSLRPTGSMLSEARRSNADPAAGANKPRKLSYREQRELDALPALIEALEAEQKQLAELLADGRLYLSDPARAVAAQTRHAAIEEELMRALERWELLAARV